MPDAARARLRFFHGSDIPGPHAASLQILRTAAAIAASGAPVSVHSGQRAASRQQIAAAYGIDLPPALEVAPLLPHPRLPGLLADGLMSRRLVRLAHRPEVWVARGAVAARLIAPAARAGAVLVYEMHGIAAIRRAERHLGRRAAPADLDTPESRAALADEARVVAAADGLIFLTDAVADAARARLGTDAPSLVLPSGTDIWDVPPAPSGPPVDAVYAGKIERRKGVHLFLDALARLPGRTALIVGGTGPALAALHARVAELGLNDRVACPGWCPPGDVPSLLMRGRVAICPLPSGVDAVSDSFSSPMKILQAMGLGLPVVASDLPPVRALSPDGRAIRAVSPDDPDALAHAIDALLGDDDARAALAAAGRGIARAHSWQIRGERLAHFAASLLPPGG